MTSWREVRAAAGGGVLLDAQLSGRRFCGGVADAAAGCPDEQRYARSTRLHGRAAGRRVFCLDVVLLRFLLDVSLTVYSFRLNCLSLVRWPLFIQITAGQPTLSFVGRQSWWAWLHESSRACRGPFSLFMEVDREGGSERVAWLAWLSYC